MLTTHLLSINPADGARTYAHHDDVTHELHFETVVDAERVLEQNLIERNDTERHTPWGDGRRVARIPNLILSQLRREGRAPDQDPVAFFRWLEDNPYFKVRNGDMRGLVTG